MNQQDFEDVLARIDDLIAVLGDFEDELYVAIEVAYQLRDEVVQAQPEFEEQNE